jgi:integrase
MNAADPDLRRLIRAALLCGARYSELARLTCRDFNADSSTVAIHTGRKGKPRHAVLTDEGKRFFAGLVAGRAGSEWLLLRENGKPWKPADQQRPMEEASDRAGIRPRVTFHVLRHTHGSLLAMNGAPMRVIADQLGHADTRMTERHYAHLAPRYVADVVRASLPDFGIVDEATPVSLDDARRKKREG